MSKRGKKQTTKSNSENRPTQNRPTLGGETVEPRILLSATWIAGTSGDDTITGSGRADHVNGLDGNDTINGGAGDDLLLGGAGDDAIDGGWGNDTIDAGWGNDTIYQSFGNDTLDGGAGMDTIDFSQHGRSVTVDLTTAEQQSFSLFSSGTLTNIEGVRGSRDADTFIFSSPTDGAIYTVDGNAGADTIDLSNFNRSDATLNDGSITVNLGGGQSFRIDHSNNEQITFADAKIDPTSQTDAVTPLAVTGMDQTANEGDQVTLSGRGSSDPNDDALTYTWRQTSGPTVTLDDPTSAQPTFTAPEGLSNTRVEFSLTVSDGTNTSTADAVVITINADNDAPTVDAGEDRVVLHDSEVRLTASAQDPENQGLNYQWRQIDGPAVDLRDGETADPSFRAPFAPEGTVLQFVVRVTDGDNTAFDTVSITIAPNAAPIVFTQSTTAIDAGETGVVTAGATDAEGDQLTFRWTQVSGPTVIMPTNDLPVLQFQAPNVTTTSTITFQVDVSDGTTTTTRMVTATVNAPATAPSRSDSDSSTDAPPATAETDKATDAAPTSEDESPIAAAPTYGTLAAPEVATSSSTNASESPAPTSTLTNSVSATPTSTETTLASTLTDSETDRDVSPSSDLLEESEEDATDQSLTRNLLTNEAAQITVTRLEQPDFVIADAGNQVDLSPRILANVGADAIEEVHWKQVSGTPVDLGDTDGAVLRIRVPEVFVSEEVIFEVEVMRGGERITQEVTVQVEPVGMTERSLSIDEYVEGQATADDGPEDEGSRGLGKIWGALLAFFGTQTGRKKP